MNKLVCVLLKNKEKFTFEAHVRESILKEFNFLKYYQFQPLSKFDNNIYVSICMYILLYLELGWEEGGGAAPQDPKTPLKY